MRVSRLIVAVFVAMLLAPIADAKETMEFMSVAELNQLLAKGPVRATFDTVPEGSTLKKYDILMKEFLYFGDIRIVVFTTDHFVVGGMSGSPIHAKGVDGKTKLVGALSYRLADFTVGTQWGGLTSIEDMHAEAQGARTALPATGVSASFSYGGKTLVPLQAKVSTRAVAAGTGADTRAWPLAAGMPITVDLLEWTDAKGTSYRSNSTGTITWVGPKGEIYAFGHPFLGARTARYRFRTARILGTVHSYAGSNKLSGAESDVMGTIDYDGAYGIYGTIGTPEHRPVTEFTADFAANGKTTGSYRVQMATTSLGSMLMDYAFSAIGETAKVPFDRQPSTVAFSASVNVEGHKRIDFSQVFTSTHFQFGPFEAYFSSYQNATAKFLTDIFIPLSSSRFGFKLNGMRVAFDFSDGVAPRLRVATAKIAPKVKWGQDAFLDLLLVSEDNAVTVRRRVKLPLDWERIEQPTYGPETADTEKTAEKVVNGVLFVYDAEHIDEALEADQNSKEQENPEYFLGATDYLDFFQRRLERTNRMLYVRTAVRKRSGLVAAGQPDVAVPTADGGETDWLLQAKGLTERKVTVREEPQVWFSAPLSPVPAGQMVGDTKIKLQFEVVK